MGKTSRPCASARSHRGSLGGRRSAFRDDCRPCFALAHAGASSHAESDDSCKQRNYKLLHLNVPPKVSMTRKSMHRMASRPSAEKSQWIRIALELYRRACVLLLEPREKKGPTELSGAEVSSKEGNGRGSTPPLAPMLGGKLCCGLPHTRLLTFIRFVVLIRTYLKIVSRSRSAITVG